MNKAEEPAMGVCIVIVLMDDLEGLNDFTSALRLPVYFVQYYLVNPQ